MNYPERPQAGHHSRLAWEMLKDNCTATAFAFTIVGRPFSLVLNIQSSGRTGIYRDSNNRTKT